jgi:hypothetical protein
MNTPRIKVIACATVIEEMQPLLHPGVTAEVLDFGLHLTPDKLRERLQKTIDKSSRDADTIILGYGLCSMAVVGLISQTCTLVVPRVDDCIAIFLGSQAAYREQSGREPGTYYLTKGWIEVSDTPLEEYKQLVEKYGQKRADKVMTMMFQHYTRLAYIDTGHIDQERCRQYARQNAEKLSLRYEEIPGDMELIRKMINGPWDDDFVVVGPGEKITFEEFKQMGTSRSPRGGSLNKMGTL